MLEWREKGSDAYFNASSFSDGTLRFICLATLLLQPLVENSIKHGLEPKVEGGTITVRARLAGKNMLCLEVSDTGVGFDSTAAASSGFGLAQVQERIAAAYEDKGSVEQKTAPGQGATTLLYLPMTTLQTV